MMKCMLVIITGKGTSDVILQNLFHALYLCMCCFLIFVCLIVGFLCFCFFKISLLMVKCQKSENFLNELQQAFSQAKRSVQEQMVRQLKPRDHLNNTVYLTFGSHSACKIAQVWLESALCHNL